MASALSIEAAAPRRRSRQPRPSLAAFLSLLAFALLVLWTGVPLAMAVLWSLVDPENPWSFPAVLPPSLSLHSWRYVLGSTDIGSAVLTSFTLAAVVTLSSFLLGLPTAWALARRSFAGREAVKVLVLLPILMPGMVIALFLGRILGTLELTQTFAGLVLGHTLLAMPFMIRILTTTFEAIPGEILDAADNLGAGAVLKFGAVILPLAVPGIAAGSIFAFITSLEEFNLTYVVGTPTYQTIPTVLFGTLGYHFVRTNAAVISLILLAPSVVLLLIAERWLKAEYLASAFGRL
jgi:putative spermidine/putrescine transport system permease protein